MTTFEKAETPGIYHMDTAVHRETYNSLIGLREMGLSKVTDAIKRIIPRATTCTSS